MKDTISKYDWLTAFECLTKAWFQLRIQHPPPTESERFRMEQGTHVGRLAQQLFSEGILVQPDENKSTVEVTNDLILDSKADVFFEAAFQHDQLVAKADILQREGKGWHILEVKSSLSNSNRINEYIDDLAFTAMVIKLCGLPVTKSSLVLLSREYRYGNEVASLFELVDKTPEVMARVDEYIENRKELISSLFSDDQPTCFLLSACRSCSYFDGECLGTGIEFSVLDIPGLHHTKVKKLSEKCVIALKDFPSEIKLNEAQERSKTAMLNNAIYKGEGLVAEIRDISWPCYYLDFETVSSVLPLYEGHACHQQVLTQYSIHSRESLTHELGHREFLADASKDCQQELAESLIRVLGQEGAIFVYSSFERTRINSMVKMFPDIAVALQAINERLVDLLKLIRAHVYHPQFRGSYSIKKVLPALVPDLSYEDLAISDGDTAMAMFAKMARGEIDNIKQVRKDLLVYCKMDTLAIAYSGPI